jgi:hypothetical protein
MQLIVTLSGYQRPKEVDKRNKTLKPEAKNALTVLPHLHPRSTSKILAKESLEKEGLSTLETVSS